MIYHIFPFLAWFKDYDLGKFRIDFLAGITVALVLIPQSMAYAQLAGLPAYYGLYAAFLPPIIASLFGSSRQLATGPVAVVSLMTSATLSPMATAGSSEFIVYAIVLACIVGVFQLSLGILRLGLVVNFLSHPVVNGFTNAAAIIIATSQLSKFFGDDVTEAEHHYETMVRVFKAAMDYTHYPTLCYGVGAVLIMVVLKKIDRRIPNVLVAVVITTLISYFTGYNKDVQVDVSAVKVPEVHEQLDAFNTVVKTIASLSEERRNVSLKLDEELSALKAAHVHGRKSVETINLQGQIEALSMKMDEQKGILVGMQTSLRTLKFEGVKNDDKTYTFYSKGAAPSGSVLSTRTWRLKIGNSPLNLSKLRIMGGGAVVGKIPEGLPKFTIPALSMKVIMKLLPTAVIITLLGFMEAIAIAKAIAAQTGQTLNPNQELIGQGLANLLGSFSSSYPVSGSFSRSAVNFQAGAVSGISSVVTSIVVIATLLFFTPLLYHLPQAVLAAIIMMAVIGLINVKGFLHAWKAQWYDGAISILTFLVTLYFAPHLDNGIFLGVLLSMTVFLYKSMRPVVASLSLNEENVLSCAELDRLKGCRHICVMRFDGAIFFANASYLDEQALKFRSERPDLRYVLLDARGINDVDASGEEALDLLCKRMRSAGLGFAMCGVKGQVMKVMNRTGLINKIGKTNIYADSRAAVAALTKKVHEETDLAQGCDNCPLTKYLPSDK
ncbi:MAG: SulP family inorganic anion transporter [Desulfocapsaceae bacterium]|nr:SulP family inorganic anion transporter [Desulfocapsaceae bacterium]